MDTNVVQGCSLRRTRGISLAVQEQSTRGCASIPVGDEVPRPAVADLVRDDERQRLVSRLRVPQNEKDNN